MKNVIFSGHSLLRAEQRGATKQEILDCLAENKYEIANSGRFTKKKTFVYDKPSPLNGVVYKWKKVEVIFLESQAEIFVVTVKVYYFD